jgi:hypothetical protein
MSTYPSKSRAHEESTAYLKLEKPCFLFLEGSGGAAAVPIVAVVALASAPTVLADAPAARAGACSTDRSAAGASAPAAGAFSAATSAGLGDGWGIPPLGGPPVALLFLLLR